MKTDKLLSKYVEATILLLITWGFLMVTQYIGDLVLFAVMIVITSMIGWSYVCRGASNNRAN